MERACIVVGVDGSVAARQAVLWAAGLGPVLGAEVVAVHAVGLLEDLHDATEEPAAWRARVLDRVTHTWCAGLAEAACPHRVVVRDGPPVDVLLAVARDEHADLLVVGSRGVGAAEPAQALGSTSLHVLQTARCPVLVVPEPPPGEPEPAPAGLRRVLVGVDRSAPSLAALDLAADLAESAGGSLCVLEVFEYVPPFPLGPSSARTSEAEERAIARTRGLVEVHARAIRDRGVGVQVIVRSGDPAPTLLVVADDVDADVVVVGTRGRGDPAQPLIGSVARAVVNRIRRPTLVVPAAAGTVRLPHAGDAPGRSGGVTAGRGAAPARGRGCGG
jgi:nucleotide-binding universal stress UspA family protein